MKQSMKQDSLHVCREKTYYKSEKCNRAAVNVLGMGVSVATLLFVSSCMHVFSIYLLDHWACKKEIIINSYFYNDEPHEYSLILQN